jgi:hypothetical protein
VSVVAIELDKPPRAEQAPELGPAIEREAIEPGVVTHHVRLADEHKFASRVAQILAQRDLTDRQRHAIPCRAVARHVAPGVERHARGSTHARLHEGALEAHAAPRERVEIARGDVRMAITAEVIGAQLIAHDEQDVADGAHLRRLL